MTSRLPPARLLAPVAAILLTATPLSAQTVFSAAGASATDIQTTVDSFRTALGPLNANNGTANASGRREINWDGVGATAQSPNPFPGDFFAQDFNGSNGGRTRGAIFEAPLGSALLVSAAASGGAEPALFAQQLAGSDIALTAFSNDKVFIADNSTFTDVTFVVPGTSGTSASISAFGAVFLDVEIAAATTLEFFALNGTSLGVFNAPVSGANGFSFLGVVFDSSVLIGRVSITAGSEALGAFANGSALRESLGDFVAMDDFIFSEPQALSAVPEPSTYAAIFGGLALAGAIGHRRRRAASRSLSS